MLSLGDSFIIVNLITDRLNVIGNCSLSTYDSKNSSDSTVFLRLKIFGGPSTGQYYYFEPTIKAINIGRSKENQVIIDDGVLSKF